MSRPVPFIDPRAEGDIAVLQGGYDGAAAPGDRRQQVLWRVGRWLRTQGAARPTSLRRADDGVVVVNGQILAIDAVGQIRNLSTTRRTSVPPPRSLGIFR
ncbi:hypothetical protein [Caulobacter sp. LARHSG274]